MRNEEVFVPHDLKISPTYVPDLADETLNLLIDGEKGIIHLANDGEVSWAEFALKAGLLAKQKLNMDLNLIRNKTSDEFAYHAKRPKYSVLKSERFTRLPLLDNALERYFNELQVKLHFPQAEMRI